MRLRSLICSIFLAASIPQARTAEGAAEPPAEAGTARDIIFRADTAYNTKRYQEAISGYKRFLDDYGASSEAVPFMAHVRYNLAASYLQLQKYDDAVEAIDDAQKVNDMGDRQKEDLLFWKAMALLQSENYGEAVKVLQDFRKTYPDSPRKRDAELLNGTALLAAGERDEALKYFTDIRTKVKDHPHAGRATVLELHSLIEEGRGEQALDLLAEIGPETGTKINQLATFQTLALSLGEKFLDEERPREAVRALQNIWPRERLLAHQKKKLEEINQSLARIESAQEPDIFERAHQKQMQREVEKELANLEKIPSFDASVRFRMATAFHDQNRYRECAMLLDDMLRKMEPDDVVEKASMSALQSWMSIERYDKAIESSLVFEEQFPASKSLPLVLYLRGTAQQKLDRHDDAIATFASLREKFDDSDQAPRALFMTGFTQLLAERNEEAAETFRQFQEQYPKHEMAEPANYWRGSALAFAKKFPEAREVLAAHAGKFPDGDLRAAAMFRQAYCAQSMKDHALAEAELKEYLEKFPDGEESAEVRLLLGDALLAQAKSDEGKEVYASIKPESGRFHEDAQFKLAKVLKLEEKYDELRALMQKYIDAKPLSPRVAEAMLQIGQSHRKEEHPEKAVEAYWKAIGEWGNDPQAAAVEEMLLALDRHYKGESEKRDFHARLRALREEAEGGGKSVLAVRCIWALARGVKKSDPALSGALLREASAMAKPEQTNPLILADCAEALLAASAQDPDSPESAERRARAAQLYRDLLKWHPRAAQKDKALAALAKVALDAGDTPTAMEYYDRLERDTPWSSLMGEVLATRAGIELEAGDKDKAVEAYTRLLAAENVPSKLKAQALLALGEIEMSRQRPQTAIPYYQRIYVLYGKWRETVAQAYLRSGEAFEQLNDTEAARKTYEELANSEDLGSLPQAQTAREKLKKFAPKDRSTS